MGIINKLWSCLKPGVGIIKELWSGLNPGVGIIKELWSGLKPRVGIMKELWSGLNPGVGIIKDLMLPPVQVPVYKCSSIFKGLMGFKLQLFTRYKILFWNPSPWFTTQTRDGPSNLVNCLRCAVSYSP